jgi:protein O-GlcNAc transferase
LPQYDDVFVRIAREVGDCQFVFLRHFGAPKATAIIRERLDSAFAAAGLRADDHCVFLNRLSQSKFVAAAGLCDVFLDSIGWSGCNSARNAWHRHADRHIRGSNNARPSFRGNPADAGRSRDDCHDDRRLRRGCNAPGPGQAIPADNFARMAANRDKVYRDRAPVTALEDFIERSVRG